MTEIHENPSERELAWFGVIVLATFAIFGAIAYWYFDSSRYAATFSASGVLLCATFYSIVPLRRILYRIWIRAFYPMSWLVTRMLFGLIYFTVITPIGLALRWSGHDPMESSAADGGQSYWTKRPTAVDQSRYLRQF